MFLTPSEIYLQLMSHGKGLLNSDSSKKNKSLFTSLVTKIPIDLTHSQQYLNLCVVPQESTGQLTEHSVRVSVAESGLLRVKPSILHFESIICKRVYFCNMKIKL